MQKKILVVDDEPELLWVLSFRLGKTGYKIFSASDGQEALDLALKIVPDLIIFDVNLPTLHGDKVAAMLKKNEKFKNVPMILISATALSLDILANECHADGFFTKPIQPEELFKRIKELIG